jgi:hypothetical protein
MVEDVAVNANAMPPQNFQQQRRQGRGRGPSNTIADSISAFINN